MKRKVNENTRPGLDNNFYDKSYKLLFSVVLVVLIILSSITVNIIAESTEENNQIHNTRASSLTGLPDSGNFNYVVLADVNEDDYIDIVAGAGGYPGNDPGGLYVYLNQNGKSFTSASTGLPGPGKNYFGSVQVIDIDKDSNLDIVAAYETQWSKGEQGGIGIWLGNGGAGGSMTWTEANSPIETGSFDSVYCSDINNDGNLDLVGGSSNGLHAWQGTLSGDNLIWTITRSGLPTSGEFTGVSLGDVNNDGRLDIVAGSYNSKGISVYLCSSSGAIIWSEGHSDTNLKHSGNSFEMYLTDLNSDSNLDIVGGMRGGMKVYIGNGNSGARNTWWTDASNGLPTSGDCYEIAVGDINGDGKLDIGTAFKMYSNKASMTEISSYSWELLDLGVSNNPQIGLAVGDLNNDDNLDIVGCGWENREVNGIKKGGIEAYTLAITTTPPKYYRLLGKVMNQKDSSPLVGATVRIDTTGDEVVTDKIGAYEFEVTDGEYELTVTLKGYKSAKKVVTVSGRDQEIDFQLLEVSDEPESKYELSGTVSDELTNQPLSNALVTLKPGDYSSNTDSQGKYVIEVPNGTYVLTIEKSNYQTQTANVEVNGIDVTKDISIQLTTMDNPDDGDDGDDKDKKKDTPGFELIIVISVLLILLLFYRKRKK